MIPRMLQTAQAPDAPATVVDYKQIMAFDALSKLTAQFAETSDTDRLIKTLALTVAGQFTCGNVFLLVAGPHTSPSGISYWATGRFQLNAELLDILASQNVGDVFDTLQDSIHVKGQTAVPPDHLYTRLESLGVNVVVPLANNGRTFGLIGLGDKITLRPYDQSDVSLLEVLAKTVAPLFINSLLFHEIKGLNQWYQGILNNVRQAVFVFDPDHRLQNVNLTGLEIARTTHPNSDLPGAVQGLHLSELFADSHFPGWSRRLLRASDQRKDRLLENAPAHIGGTERIFNLRVSTITRRDDPGTHLIVTADDITGQKESERRLFDLEKLAEKGTMASAISHELNNYLGFILGGVGLTQMAVCDGDMERAQQSLLKIQTAIEKMTRFTKGLMDYGKLRTTKATNDLNEIVADVLGFVTIQKKFMRLAITTDLHPDLPQTELDGDQVAQLLLNLLNNAADAIAEANHDEGKIQVDTTREDGWIVLRVADNGAGISPEAKNKLFKARFTTKDDGHGYGLVTCSKIIENHGGRVDVESTPGAGTSFTIRLPVAAVA